MRAGTGLKLNDLGKLCLGLDHDLSIRNTIWQWEKSKSPGLAARRR